MTFREEIYLCEESIARIPKAWKHFSNPYSVDRDVCIEAITTHQFVFDSGSGKRFQASGMRTWKNFILCLNKFFT